MAQLPKWQSFFGCIALSQALTFHVFALWGGISPSQFIDLTMFDVLLWWSIPQTCALAVGLGSAYTLRSHTTLGFTVRALGTSTISLLGIVALHALPLLLTHIHFMVLGISLLLGIGTGGMLLASIHMIHVTHQKSLPFSLLGAQILSCIEYLCIDALPQSIHGIALIIVVFLGGICTLPVLCRISSLRSNSYGVLSPIPSQEVIYFLRYNISRPLACICTLAFAVALTRTLALSSIEDPRLVNILGSVIVCVTCIACVSTLQRIPHLNFLHNFHTSLFRILFMIVATLLMFLATITYPFMATLVTSIVYAIFELTFGLLIVVCIEYAHRNNLYAITLFGLIGASIFLVFSIATSIGAGLLLANQEGIPILSITVLIVLYVIGMTYMVITGIHPDRNATRTDSFSHNIPSDQAVQYYASKQAIPSDQSIETLRRYYKLTPRESDVLSYLLRGRDVPAIARELVLSENTIRSHVKRLYVKTNVHSRQELIDLVEKAVR